MINIFKSNNKYSKNRNKYASPTMNMLKYKVNDK